MDPLSITVSVVTLITISAQVTSLVRQFRNEVNVVDTTLNGILSDVDSFQQVLESMKETFDQDDIRGGLQTTGHVGSHWKNLSRSLSDGESTLEQLRSLIMSVSRSAKFLDAPRKHHRFKSAIAQIAEFREQIQSYRAALQLSLSTVILWNQSTLQKTTDQIPDKVIPDLNKLYEEFRHLGTVLNAKIEKLQSTVSNQGYHAESELMSMTNLKECVQSAADVVSTASTTLAPETSERASVKYGSDFGDVFRKDSNEPMQRWISSNTVYEYEDAEAPAPDPSETSTRDAFTEYQSDSESDIENELVRALFNDGKKRKTEGDLKGAERNLQNCLSRFPTTSSYNSLASSQTMSITGVSKAELLELLTETYCLQGAWTQARSTMKDKLAITEHQAGKKSERYLWDTYKLSEVLTKTKDYAEAHLRGRQSLRGFKKLREQGFVGYEKSLTLLILICSEQGNTEDEEAYTALLGSHQSIMREGHTVSGLRLAANEKTSCPPVDTPLSMSAQISPDPDVDDEEHVETQLRAKSSLSEISAPTQKPPEPIEGLAISFGTSQTRRTKPVGSPVEAAPNQLVTSDPVTPTMPNEQDQTPSEESIPAIDSPHSRPSSSPRLPSMSFTPFKPDVYQYGSFSIPPVPVDMAVHRSDDSKRTNGLEPAVKHASRRYGVMIEAKDSDKDSDKEGAMSYTKLLTALCKKEFGRKPLFMVGRGREGYKCIVTLATAAVDADRKEEIAKVSGYETREEARHAAAAIAYASLKSRVEMLRETVPFKTAVLENPVLDRSSDKEFYMTPTQAKMDPPPYTPSDMTSPVPEIMVSPTIDSTPFAAITASNDVANVAIRRAASDSQLPFHKIPMTPSGDMPGESDSERPWTKPRGNLGPTTSSHRRAASTTARPAEWTSGDDLILAWSQPPAPSSQRTDTHSVNSKQVRSGAHPNVTFDAIENSVYKPDLDSTTFVQRSFLSKTFSLQDRRSKSDDANLTKKKSLRSILLPSSLTRSTSVKQEGVVLESQADCTATCPVCNKNLNSLSDDDRTLHANSCLDKLSNQPLPEVEAAFELPGSDPSFTAVELPAPTHSQRSAVSNEVSKGPKKLVADPDALWDLHRAYSKRDLSMDKFEAAVALQPNAMTYNRSTSQVSQRQVLLLGDSQCGKTSLATAWCYGTPAKVPSASLVFTKDVNGTELVLHDRTALAFIRDHMRQAYPGSLPVILLCFDITSVDTFESVERRWNLEADLYPENVSKILVGCKKDLKSGATRSVWTRDAYSMTAMIKAKAYFETSAYTKEGLEALFSHVARMPAR